LTVALVILAIYGTLYGACATVVGGFGLWEEWRAYGWAPADHQRDWRVFYRVFVIGCLVLLACGNYLRWWATG
jgi:hypothetical protein